MTTAADCSKSSPALALVSALFRTAPPPSVKEWEYLLTQFTADQLFAVSNWLLDIAKKMEAKGQAA